MLRTALTDRFDLGCPIVSAALAFAARPSLAAAVSNAGAMGFLGADLVPGWTLMAMIQATQGLTSRPFGVGFVGAYVTDDQVRACLTIAPAAVAFLGPPPMQTWLDELRCYDIDVWLQANSPSQARQAVRSGANAVIVQGEDTNVYASPTSLARLLPAVSQAVAPLPVIASGDIADGRRLAAVLMLGADAAWCRTRFLASEEARVCPRRFRPGEGDIAQTSVCVLPSDQRATAPAADGAGVEIGTGDIRQWLLGAQTRLDTRRYEQAVSSTDLAAILPTPEVLVRTTSDTWPARLRAGGQWPIKAAAQIVREMSDEADVVIEALLSAVSRRDLRPPR